MPSWKDKLSPPTASLELPAPVFSFSFKDSSLGVRLQETQKADSLEEVRLARQSNALKQLHRFHQLLCLERLEVSGFQRREALSYAAIRRILGEMHGRVLLAHEPGFDARLEIGLLVDEMLRRGMLSKVLLLASPMFGEYWREQLEHWTQREFHWASSVPQHPSDFQVLSLESLQTPLPESFVEHGYELVVVEGAEILKKRRSPAYRNLLGLAPDKMILHSFAPIEEKALDIHPLLALLSVPELPPASVMRRELEEEEHITPETRAVLRPYLQQAVLRNTEQAFSMESTRIPWKTVESPPSHALLECRNEFWGWLRALPANLWDLEDSKTALLETARLLFSSTAAAVSSLDSWSEVKALQEVLEEAAGWKERFLRVDKQDPRWKAAVRFVQVHPQRRILLFCHHPETRQRVEEALLKAGEPFRSKHRVVGDEEEVRVFVASDGEVPEVEGTLDYIVSLDLPWFLSLIERRAHWFRLEQGTTPRHFFQMLLPDSPEKALFDAFEFRLKPSTLVPDEVHAMLRHFPEGSWNVEPLQAFVMAEERDEFFEELSQQLLEARRRYRQIQDFNRRLFLDDYAI